MLEIQPVRIPTIPTELLAPPLPLRGTPRTPVPELSREGIRWTGGVGGKPLEVAMDFQNPGRSFSESVTARIDIAPFGAFVPGELLATAAVPSLPPGGRWTFRTAIASGDLPGWAGERTLPRGLPRPLRWEGPSVDPALQNRQSAIWSWKSLPADDRGGLRRFFDLRHAIKPGAHFIGNLNVFVTERPVERHMARAVKLKPGHPNVAMFCVGNRLPAEYRFQPAVCEAGWHMDLMPYAWDRQVQIAFETALLIIVPPEKAESGKAAVRVERVSTRESALVEFELEVGASGSKCYFF